MLYGVFQGIYYFLQIIQYGLLAYCVLTWILQPYHKVMRFFARFADPLLRPIRNVMYRIFPRMPIDLSPLIMYFLINFAQSLLWRLYRLF